MNSCSFEELQEMLRPWGQEQLLRFWKQLSSERRQAFAAQLGSIDWKAVSGWIRQALAGECEAVDFAKLTPAPYVSMHPEDAAAKARLAEGRAAGEALLRQGKVAAFTVAGGQGTRLGYDGPKGTYCFSPLRNKSLFQYFAESLLNNRRKYGAAIPWYIMTSPANNQATVDFFRANGFFGLPEEDVKFFVQGTLPGFGLDGKALLEAEDSMALFANGHGGTLAALRDSGTLEDMARRGVDYLSYFQVDNPLITVCDPLFIGLHHLSGSEMSSRALIKRDSKEKLGHFCNYEGHLVVVEYSDMPDTLTEQRDAGGKLTFRAGSPAMHVISRTFIERLTDGKLALTPHRANKKIACLDEAGRLVKPDSPNGIKLEFFIFDALPMAKSTLILEADRAEQFAPIKNAEGSDSADSCRAALAERTARWLEAAGVKVPRKADGTPDAKLEISLLKANCAEDVAALVASGVIPKTLEAGAVLAID